MPKKNPANSQAVTAADIERSIQALNKMAERLWGDGREAEAKALLDALDALNRALDRIRIGESRRVITLHWYLLVLGVLHTICLWKGNLPAHKQESPELPRRTWILYFPFRIGCPRAAGSAKGLIMASHVSGQTPEQRNKKPEPSAPQNNLVSLILLIALFAWLLAGDE
jgi:hypothetical protein